MRVESIPSEQYTGALESVSGQSRVAGVILRCKSVSIMVIEAYLWSGEELSDRNIELLQGITEMVQVSCDSGR